MINQKNKENPVAHKIEIVEFVNGDVSVTNFPLDPDHAIEILLMGIKAITRFFVNAGMEGKLAQTKKMVLPDSDMSEKLNIN